MAAEFHLLCRSKPPQVPAAGTGMEKRRLRMVQFSGDLLHPTGIGRFVQDANPGRVPPEGVAGKSIDNVQFVTHKTG